MSPLFQINILSWMILQDSFYHNLTEEELKRVHEYNFDHPGEGIPATSNLRNISEAIST